MPISRINVFYQEIKFLNTCLKSDIKRHVKKGTSQTTPKFKTLIKDIVELSRKKTDLTTESAKFFGVTNNKDILGQIANHGCLTYMKSMEHSIIQSFPKMEHLNLENLDKLQEIKNLIWEDKKIEKLFEYGAAKLSFSARIFGKRTEDITHTIGIVADKNTKNIYILDSLSEFTQSIHDYRQKLKFLFTNSTDKSAPKIIFSTKPQQTLQEYTCNNWTYANIEAVKNALAQGQKIEDTNSLNKILPDNINKILDEQRQYVLDNKNEFMDKFRQSGFKLSCFSRQR